MTAQVVALAILVAVVGMPHGGLDHRFGRAVLSPILGRRWVVAFVVGYSAIMIGVAVGWWSVPLLTLAGFVVLSAMHFGLSETESSSLGWLVFAVARGGLVVGVPALFQPTEFTQLLTWVVPRGEWPTDLLFEPIAQSLLGSLVLLGIIGSFATSLGCGVRIVGFIAAFAVLPPLVSFTLYFCGWHSTLELIRLVRQAYPNHIGAGLGRVLREAAPLSTLAVVMIAAGGWIGASSTELTPSLVQTVFVGLSIVAVPHLLLHVVAARKNVNPFAEDPR